jgi:hypothetical protein
MIMAGVDTAHAWSLGERAGYACSLEGYLRQDVVSLKNTVDLDSANSDDTTTYYGIDYSLAARAKKDAGPEFYLKLERNGPFDYDAPVWVHNTLISSGGTVNAYRNEELLPGVEEFWADVPLTDALRAKAGLFTYEVGNCFSMHGSYETFSAMLYGQRKDIQWRLYYARPELELKLRRGPHIAQEEDQGIVHHSGSSNFFAADALLSREHWSLWPYAGMLVDYTSPEKRDSVFTAPIDRDYLATAGIAWDGSLGKWRLKAEAARNFGYAHSADPAYEDIEHAGYMAYQKTAFELGKVTPALQFLVCSGNKATLDDAANAATTLTSGRDRAFSSYSAANMNPGYSICSSNSEARPMLLMGAGDGINYGVPRPGTFSSADFDNIIVPSLGVDAQLTERLSVSVYSYYIRSWTPGVGTLNGEPIRLSPEIGYETDLFAEYTLPHNAKAIFAFGHFTPGAYYTQSRDDTDGSLFSPYVRGDGKADPAYQIELSLELTF